MRSIATTTFFFVGLWPTPVRAQVPLQSCAGVEVRSISVAYEPAQETPLDGGPEVPAQPARPAAAGDTTIVARGPVLGSMDSPEVSTLVSCTSTGFSLTAAISRSADYKGSALQNQLWRPRISMAISFRNPEIAFQMVWKMRLTTGAEVDRARTPPYSELKYPIILESKLRSEANAK